MIIIIFLTTIGIVWLSLLITGLFWIGILSPLGKIMSLKNKETK